MSVDLTQFHDAFFDESLEALQLMESTLLTLSEASPDPESVNTIFRVAHSIKGGGATFGFDAIASITHSLESLLDELRSKRMALTPPICGLLFRSVDVVRAMLGAARAKQPTDKQGVADLQFDIERMILGKRGDMRDATCPAAIVEWRITLRATPDFFEHNPDPARLFRELEGLGSLTVTAHLDALPSYLDMDPRRCYLSWSLVLASAAPETTIREIFTWLSAQCELTLTSDGAAPAPVPNDAHRVAAIAEPAHRIAAPDAGSIRVAVQKVDELINTVGELVIAHAMLSQIIQGLPGQAADALLSGMQQLERTMRQLQESVMRVRMLPISTVFNRFPRMVHDLAKRLDKQVGLSITGDTTEIDKTVLEKIGDPLLHLVRNCVDHGIEPAAARVRAGKSAIGSITLSAAHRGSSIVIEVADDGAGLDVESILAKARAAGLVGPADQPDAQQIQELIFSPGVTTSEVATDVSGRGVGMDVVRRNITELGGKIEVRSDRGHGSRFLITLPLTLAIVEGLSVAVGDQTYILPMMSTIESLRLSPNEATGIADGREVFRFRNEYLPIVRLYKLFAVEPRARALHEGLVVVVEGSGRRIGLFVDDLLGQQQVVIKSLETHYGRIAGVSAATILGDGSVALILDVADLIRSAAYREAA